MSESEDKVSKSKGLVPKSARALERGSTSSDASVSAPKEISSRTELPPGSVVKENIAKITPEIRRKFICYSPNSLQTGLPQSDKRKRVWLVVEKELLQHTTSFLALMAYLRPEFIIEHRVAATAAIIKSLQDDADNNEVQLNVTGGGEARSGDVGKYFEEMLGYSIAEKISDIHIERKPTNSVIRVRKHGDLMMYDNNISNTFATRLSRVIYEIFGTDQEITFREDSFQVASVDWVSRGEAVKLRVQTLPTYMGGFDVVLRVLPIGTDEESIVPMEKLGYSPQQVKALMEIAARPTGALIIAGTTGSGKSTTLKNLLMYINNARNYRCKIYTIEDPPEYKIPFVSQIPVNRASVSEGESAFTPPLKATMRGDPDILMLGEIRDKETADGMRKITQSGHQMLSTVHATRALGIPPRLRDLGVESSLLGSPDFLTGLIYQKLMPVLCPKCSLSFRDIIASSTCTEADAELAERLEQVADLSEDDIRIRGPNGCEHCKYMGIVDRSVCAEIIAPDLKILHSFETQNIKMAEYHWLALSDEDPDSENMLGKTVLEHALLKMRRGMISPYDVETLLEKVNFAKLRREEIKQFYSDTEMKKG